MPSPTPSWQVRGCGWCSRPACGTTPDDVEVNVLSATSCGMTQIAAAQKHRTGVEAIHIISHGGAGELLPGTERLSADTLTSNDGALATVKAALNPGTDIVLYGCDVDGDMLIFDPSRRARSRRNQNSGYSLSIVAAHRTSHQQNARPASPFSTPSQDRARNCILAPYTRLLIKIVTSSTPMSRAA